MSLQHPGTYHAQESSYHSLCQPDHVREDNRRVQTLYPNHPEAPETCEVLLEEMKDFDFATSRRRKVDQEVLEMKKMMSGAVSDALAQTIR
jgi:hypothetical protein